MKQTYTTEQVRRCCIAYANGQSVSKLAEILSIPRSTIYTWIKREQQKAKHHLPIYSITYSAWTRRGHCPPS